MVLKRRIPLEETEKEPYIGVGLGRMRNERDWTQEKLAEKSNLSYRTIQKLEHNINSPTLHSIVKLAKAFEMENWEFLKNINNEIIYKYPRD
jgi:transcriptional regulator with XRE-family HTH domain